MSLFKYKEHSKQEWQDFLDTWHKGEKVEIHESIFDYFLGVLPPVFMWRQVELIDGTRIYASFGFAEGSERVTAFWSVPLYDKEDGGVLSRRYFCQHTKIINRG